MVDVDEVALRALHGGVEQVARAAFEVGASHALAIDRSGPFAAVLVISRRHPDEWVLDVVRFEAVNGNWESRGGSGATYGDLPIDEPDDGETGVLVLTSTTSSSSDDDETIIAIGGFVGGPVVEIEIATTIETRRMRLGPHPTAFVGIVRGDSSNGAGAELRALGAAGEVLDDTRDWRQADPVDGAMSLSEAVDLPDGTTALVRGSLLVLDDGAWLCDEVLPGLPPRAAEPNLRVEPFRLLADLGGTSWTPGQPGVHRSIVLMRGIVTAGELQVGPTDE